MMIVVGNGASRERVCCIVGALQSSLAEVKFSGSGGGILLWVFRCNNDVNSVLNNQEKSLLFSHYTGL